ncbi:MAG: SMI1/KNR4 family protein [Chitinophaga sp.]|jgi:hypothetical protein|nr:SMI1/KNR4 family protein [Chitinophaga sp.]
MQLKNILTKYNFSQRINVAKTTLEEIENQILVSLPEDYKFYLENFDGFFGSIGLEFVNLWGCDEILERNNSYGIINKLPMTLGIGDNASSEFIAIEFYNLKVNRIILSPLIDLDKQYHLTIGDSFTDFLTRLDNNESWFS